MPQDITDVSTFTAPIVAPASGDPETAASVLVGLQGLANRTRYLLNQVNAIPYTLIAAASFGAGSATATGATFFTGNSWDTNTSFVSGSAAQLISGGSALAVLAGDIIDMTLVTSGFVANTGGSTINAQLYAALQYSSGTTTLGFVPDALATFVSPPLTDAGQISFTSPLSLQGMVTIASGEAGNFTAYVNARAGAGGSSPTSAGLAYAWSLSVRQWRAGA